MPLKFNICIIIYTQFQSTMQINDNYDEPMV